MKTHTKDKSLGAWEKELDTVFSEYIRVRDVQTDGKIHCFTCGASVPWRQAQNGHFIKRGNMPTRYSEYNCHAVCEPCNCFDPKHDDNYRAQMLSRYGIENVERMEREAKGLQKFMRFEIQGMINHYKQKVIQLKRQKGL